MSATEEEVGEAVSYFMNQLPHRDDGFHVTVIGIEDGVVRLRFSCMCGGKEQITGATVAPLKVGQSCSLPVKLKNTQ